MRLYRLSQQNNQNPILLSILLLGRLIHLVRTSDRFIYCLPLFMCMKISKKELLMANSAFGGSLRSGSSIDYALDKQKNKRLGFYKKLAYLVRAIIVDHPFTDGNKSTALYVGFVFAEKNKKHIDIDNFLHQIVTIAKKNITDIRQIEWRLKNAIK